MVYKCSSGWPSLELLLLRSSSSFSATHNFSLMASHEIEQGPIKRMISSSTNSLSKEDKQQLDAEMFTTPAEHDNAERDRRKAIYNKYRPYILGFTAMVILGWWISSIVLKATRHRWWDWLSQKKLLSNCAWHSHFYPGSCKRFSLGVFSCAYTHRFGVPAAWVSSLQLTLLAIFTL